MTTRRPREKKKKPAKKKAAPSKNGVRVELVSVATLRAHPRNYREHPDEQLAHLRRSIKTHGLYRNIVIARDGTILAGHGVLQAAMQLGISKVPVVRLDVAPDDEQALQVLIGDNEIATLATIDDATLVELLRALDDGAGLDGTGYDADKLAALVMRAALPKPDDIFDATDLPDAVSSPNAADGQSYIIYLTFPSREPFLDAIGLLADQSRRDGIKDHTRLCVLEGADVVQQLVDQRGRA